MNIRNIVIIWLSRIVLNLVSPENKTLFRKLENVEKIKIGTQLHSEFNQIYIIHILDVKAVYMARIFIHKISLC